MGCCGAATAPCWGVSFAPPIAAARLLSAPTSSGASIVIRISSMVLSSLKSCSIFASEYILPILTGLEVQKLRQRLATAGVPIR